MHPPQEHHLEVIARVRGGLDLELGVCEQIEGAHQVFAREAARELCEPLALAFYGLHLARAARLWTPTVDAFQIPEVFGGRQVLDKRMVDALHASSVALHVWTIDEEVDMRRLLAWGVDGIMTDRPDRLARVLHQTHGRALPPGPPPGEAEPWLERLLRAG